MTIDAREYQRQWRARNPGRNALACKKWKLSHPGYRPIHSPGYWDERRESGRTALALRKYRAAHPGLHYEQVKVYIKANPEKAKAHAALNQAVRLGKLVRLPCEACGNARSHAHHPDYAKPLVVIWLCALCHKKAHRKQTHEETLRG